MKLDITSILGLSDEAVMGTPSKQPSGSNNGGSGASSPEVCKCYCRQISYPEGDGANMEDSMTKCSLKSDSPGPKSQVTQTCDVDCNSQSSEASVDCDDSDACSASCDNMTKKPGRHRLDSCDLYYQKCVRNEKIAGKLLNHWTEFIVVYWCHMAVNALMIIVLSDLHWFFSVILHRQRGTTCQSFQFLLDRDRGPMLNALTVWWHRLGSTLAQVMAWCRMLGAYGTKPSPEPMLSYHQQGFVACTWEQFNKNCSRIQSIKLIRNIHFWNSCHISRGQWVNSSPPGQNGCHFTDNILKCIFVNEKLCILIQISLKFVPKGLLTIRQHWFR